MCTVTYIPTGDDSFILTHNRDESVRRDLASPPISRKVKDVKYIYPVDPKGKGTWIGISENNRVASLLNGGNEKYYYDPPYRHSRGLVILDYFKYPAFDEFVDNYNFNDLEPFTMIVLEKGSFFELVLNEKSVQVKELDPSFPQIYSSTMLYPLESKLERRKEFFNWYNDHESFKQDEVVQFHHKFLFENEKDKSMITGNHILNTVSITSIAKSPDKADVAYLDLVNDVHLKKTIGLNDSVCSTC